MDVNRLGEGGHAKQRWTAAPPYESGARRSAEGVASGSGRLGENDLELLPGLEVPPPLDAVPTLELFEVDPVGLGDGPQAIAWLDGIPDRAEAAAGAAPPRGGRGD